MQVVLGDSNKHQSGRGQASCSLGKVRLAGDGMDGVAGAQESAGKHTAHFTDTDNNNGRFHFAFLLVYGDSRRDYSVFTRHLAHMQLVTRISIFDASFPRMRESMRDCVKDFPGSRMRGNDLNK
jgi:hypothetical protein